MAEGGDSYDLVALGTGSAATKVAQACREAGWKVAIVGPDPMGGTCALHGCEPKKTLRTVAEALDLARRLGEAGIRGAGDLAIDWSDLQAFKRGFTDPVPDKRAAAYAEAGIDVFHGAARFIGPDAVSVDGRTLKARHVLIATGGRPAPLPIDDPDGLLATSDDFLDLPLLPRRIVLVGGGYISFEFAHIAARAGAEVAILHEDDRPLAHFDRDLVGRLVEHTRRRVGVAVELSADVAALERGRGGEGVVVRTKDGRRFEADLAVHGSGRVPNLDGLGLEAAGVERDEKGKLRLDRHLRSASNPAVFAAGDAAGAGPPLTPVATLDAEAVAANLLEGCSREPDYRGVPSAVFTIPPLTMVGFTEEQAREKGLEFDVREEDMASYQSVRREREPTAAFKVLLERGGKGRVLGAHLLGPGAEEVVNLFALAVRLEMPASDLRRLVSAYPSAGSNLARMLGA